MTFYFADRGDPGRAFGEGYAYGNALEGAANQREYDRDRLERFRLQQRYDRAQQNLPLPTGPQALPEVDASTPYQLPARPAEQTQQRQSLLDMWRANHPQGEQTESPWVTANQLNALRERGRARRQRTDIAPRFYSDFELSRNPELRQRIQDAQQHGELLVTRTGVSGGRAGGGGGGVRVQRIGSRITLPGSDHTVAYEPDGRVQAQQSPTGQESFSVIEPQLPTAVTEQGGPQDIRTPHNQVTPEDVARLFGVPLNSGRRTIQHNREVNGSRTSLHLQGTAADIPVPPEVRGESAEVVRDFVLRRFQQQYGIQPTEVLYGTRGHLDHVHIGWNGGGGNTSQPQARTQQVSNTAAPRIQVDPLTTRLSIDRHPAVMSLLEQATRIRERAQLAQQYGQDAEPIVAQMYQLTGQVNQARGMVALSQFTNSGSTQGLSEVLTAYNGGVPTLLQRDNEGTFVVTVNGQVRTENPLSAAEVVAEMQRQLSPEYQQSLLEHQLEMQQSQFESDLELRNNLATGDQETQREIYSRLLQGQSAFAVERLRQLYRDVQFHDVGDGLVIAMYRDENGELQQQEFYTGDVESPDSGGRNNRETRTGVLSGPLTRFRERESQRRANQ